MPTDEVLYDVMRSSLLLELPKKSIGIVLLAIFMIALSLIIGRVQNIEWRTLHDADLPVTAKASVHTKDQSHRISDDAPNLGLSEYRVNDGDTLDSVRKRFFMNDQLYGELLEADSALLALDNIKAGQKFIFNHQGGQLSEVTLVLNPAKRIKYIRDKKGKFSVAHIDLPGIWKNIYLEGDIARSFSHELTAKGAKLSEIHAIQKLLKNRINFSRDIQPGNVFKVLLSRQFVGGELTGQSRMLALELKQKNKTTDAYFYKGRYYDAEGTNIEQSFDLKPFKGSYKISSHFSLARKHPITGEVKPHLGTDYALPVGTNVHTTADGSVSRVVHHRYAGLYVEIDHGNQYKTRYLHLSKALVKVGQHVPRGALIAQSGASGRITSAHLHYEFHVAGKPVNSLKAAASRSLSLTPKEKVLFTKEVALLKGIIKGNKNSLSVASR